MCFKKYLTSVSKNKNKIKLKKKGALESFQCLELWKGSWVRGFYHAILKVGPEDNRREKNELYCEG